MAQIIDTVAVRVDADTSLFDKKLKSIKDELKKIQRINIDINKQTRGGGQGGIGVGGALAAGALGGAAFGGRGGSSITNISGASRMPKPKPIPVPSPDKVNNLAKAFDKLSQSMKNIPKINLNLTGDPKKDIVEFNRELAMQAKGWKNVAEESRQARIVIRDMLKQKFVKGDLRNALKGVQKGLRDDKFSKVTPYSGKDPFGEGTKTVNLQTWKLLEKQIKDIEDRFNKAEHASKRFSRALSRMKAIGIASIKPISHAVGYTLNGAFGVAQKALGGLFRFGKAIFAKLKYVALAAFAAISVAAKKGFSIGMEDKRAYANVDAAVAATGKQIGLSAEQVKGFADELDRTTNFDGAELANAAGILATFVNIKSDKFKDVLTTATDLSAAFGQDLKSSTVQLGKALNDPIKGITALSRVGVSFTEAEKAKVKALMASNDLLGAQELILRSIKSQGIQGQAFAQADSVNQAKKGFEDLQVAVSSFIVKFFRLKPLFDNARGWFDAISAKINAFTKSERFAVWSANVIYVFKRIWLFISTAVKGIGGRIIWLTKRFSGFFDGLFKGLAVLEEFAIYIFAGEQALSDFIAKKNQLDSELNSALNAPQPFEDIDVNGALPVIEKELDDVADAANNTNETFKDLVRTINQGTGATSIFDSVMDSMNDMLSGNVSLKMREWAKWFPSLASAIDPEAMAGATGGSGSVSNATAGSSEPSIYSQLINAIQTQTVTLVNSLDKIDKSVQNISIVI